MNLTNFVNDCRNIVWLSGYAKKAEDGSMLLYQSSNEATAIPISMPKHLRFPAPNVACEVKCHAFGYRDTVTGHSAIRLDALHIKRAAVTSTPRARTFLNALRDKASAASNPFAPREEVIEEVRHNLQLEAGAVEMLLADASRRIGNDGFQNRVVLSGFVGHKAFIPPADDGSGDLGAVQFMLRQTVDESHALVARVRGADARFSKELKTLHPLTVIGKVSVLATKDDAGAVIQRRVVLDTDRNNVGLATLNDFAGKSWPQWWRSAVEDHYKQRRALDEKSRVGAASAPANTPAQPTPVAAATATIKPEAALTTPATPSDIGQVVVADDDDAW